MDYHLYKKEDFIIDEDFISWVKHPDQQSNHFWDRWLEENPQKRELVQEARRFVLRLDFEKKELSVTRANALLSRINQEIEEPTDVFEIEKEPHRGKILRFRLLRNVAAAIILLLGLGITYVSLQKEAKTYTTVYQEIKYIELPDGSRVVLNANSSLKLNKNWRKGKLRELWLEGEAYFSVSSSRQYGGAAFIVHAGDAAVEVVGTEFNLRRRKEEVRVLLTEGKVNVYLGNEATKDGKKEVIQIKVGEMLEYDEKNRVLSTQEVNTAVYTSWKTDKLVFEGTPFSEIVDIITYTYGHEVIVKDIEIMNRKLSGTFPSDDFDSLLKAVSLALEIQINKTEAHTIMINL